MPAYLTEQDEQTYGRELIDFATRAAAHTVAPHLQYLEAQNASLRQQLNREQRHRVDLLLQAAVPDCWEINQSPAFHAWLRQIAPLSGKPRQALLDEATQAADAPRIIALFKAFLRESGAQAHRAAERVHAPGSRSSRSSGEPVYTREQIKHLYELHRKGQLTGQRWAEIEQSIIAASRDGRVSNPVEVWKVSRATAAASSYQRNRHYR